MKVVALSITLVLFLLPIALTAVNPFQRLASLDASSLLTMKSTAPKPDVWCIVKHCGSSAASCYLDSLCKKALTCLGNCSEGDQGCTFECLDSYDNQKLDDFIYCALQEYHCIPLPPPPGNSTCFPPKNLSPKFTMDMLDGQWFIVKGLNPTYDCFDCQITTFVPPSAKVSVLDFNDEKVKNDKLSSVSYKVVEQYFTKSLEGNTYNKTAIEYTFSLVPDQPALIHMNGTETGLIHSEDWRILDVVLSNDLDSSRNLRLNDDNDVQYVFAYYCGTTLNWVYQGSVVYARSADPLPAAVSNRFASVAKLAGLWWDKYCTPKASHCS